MKNRPIKVKKLAEVAEESRRKQAERALRAYTNGLQSVKKDSPDVYEKFLPELRELVV